MLSEIRQSGALQTSRCPRTDSFIMVSFIVFPPYTLGVRKGKVARLCATFLQNIWPSLKLQYHTRVSSGIISIVWVILIVSNSFQARMLPSSLSCLKVDSPGAVCFLFDSYRLAIRLISFGANMPQFCAYLIFQIQPKCGVSVSLYLKISIKARKPHFTDCVNCEMGLPVRSCL